MNKSLQYLDNMATHGLGIEKKRPTFVNFSLSNRCNSRCKMCDIWRYPSNDLRDEELYAMLSNEYLSEIEVLGLTGGEPFLRKDIGEIAQFAVKHFSRLKYINVTSNGYNTQRILRFIEESLPRFPGHISFGLTLSIDGYGETHSHIRGMPKAWEKIQETLIALRPHRDRVRLSAACTICTENASFDNLSRLYEFMEDWNLKPIFRVAVEVDRIYNQNLIEKSGLKPGTNEAAEVIRFIKRYLLHELTGRTTYYHMIVDMLSGKIETRQIKCKEMRDGAMLDSNGDVYVCSVSGEKYGSLCTDDPGKLSTDVLAARKKVRETKCSGCFHDHISYKAPLEILQSAGRIIYARFDETAD